MDRGLKSHFDNLVQDAIANLLDASQLQPAFTDTVNGSREDLLAVIAEYVGMAEKNARAQALDPIPAAPFDLERAKAGDAIEAQTSKGWETVLFVGTTSAGLVVTELRNMITSLDTSLVRMKMASSHRIAYVTLITASNTAYWHDKPSLAHRLYQGENGQTPHPDMIDLPLFLPR